MLDDIVVDFVQQNTSLINYPSLLFAICYVYLKGCVERRIHFEIKSHLLRFFFHMPLHFLCLLLTLR